MLSQGCFPSVISQVRWCNLVRVECLFVDRYTSGGCVCSTGG